MRKIARSFPVIVWCVFTFLLAALGQTADGPRTATPIRHLVVIFPENISFDHYFGMYPHAANPPNGPGAVNPFRLDRSQAATADQAHDYTPEQMAFHAGLMDLFPKSVGRGNKPTSGPHTPLNTTGLTMGYFDGNTVTALWNYAQRFAMSDNSYGSNFGPSTPGAINLVSGQTNGV